MQPEATSLWSMEKEDAGNIQVNMQHTISKKLISTNYICFDGGSVEIRHAGSIRQTMRVVYGLAREPTDVQFAIVDGTSNSLTIGLA
jgi:hypothetical protein